MIAVYRKTNLKWMRNGFDGGGGELLLSSSDESFTQSRLIIKPFKRIVLVLS